MVDLTALGMIALLTFVILWASYMGARGPGGTKMPYFSCDEVDKTHKWTTHEVQLDGRTHWFLECEVCKRRPNAE